MLRPVLIVRRGWSTEDYKRVQDILQRTSTSRFTEQSSLSTDKKRITSLPANTSLEAGASGISSSSDKVTNNPKTTKHNAEYHSAVDILWERSEPVTPDAESDPSKPKDYNNVGSSPINAEGQELADKGTNYLGNSHLIGEYATISKLKRCLGVR